MKLLLDINFSKSLLFTSKSSIAGVPLIHCQSESVSTSLLISFAWACAASTRLIDLCIAASTAFKCFKSSGDASGSLFTIADGFADNLAAFFFIFSAGWLSRFTPPPFVSVPSDAVTHFSVLTFALEGVRSGVFAWLSVGVAVLALSGWRGVTAESSAGWRGVTAEPSAGWRGVIADPSAIGMVDPLPTLKNPFASWSGGNGWPASVNADWGWNCCWCVHSRVLLSASENVMKRNIKRPVRACRFNNIDLNIDRKNKS